PRVCADDAAVETLDGSRDERLGRALANEAAVVAADEADVHAVGLRRRRSSEPCRDRTGLRLVCALADGKLEPREHSLTEHVAPVRLILRRLARKNEPVRTV